jgi:hypothetical protein
MVTAMPRKRRRVQRFALALDTGRGAVASHDPALVPLLRLAEALSVGPHPAPTAEFRAALRQRLLAVAAVSPATAPAPVPAAPWRRRLVAAGTALAITTGGAAATAVASTDALPGDTLYDVKRAVENVQLALAASDLAKGERHLQIAATRLDEVAQLLEQSGPKPTDPVLIQQLRKTLGSMATSTELGSEEFFSAYRESHDLAVLQPLDGFLREQARDLTALTPLLPVDVLDSSRELMSGLARIAEQLLALTGGRSGAGLTGKAAPAAAATDTLRGTTPGTTGPGELPLPLPNLPDLPAQGDRLSGDVGGAASGVASAVPKEGVVGLEVDPDKNGLPGASLQSGSGTTGLPLPVPDASAGISVPTDDESKLLGVVPLPSVTADTPLDDGLQPKLK